ncbi:DUF6524 family protein [Pseudomonadales bacterium]|nr:DUF6524 family protein [Pseudomonadales bacterium]MDB4090460.1 DUF6524 family protein [Pseudomonadales bacterium]MDB4528951.1 DUF6524 family protein [Pseudomonadales bacterium]
MSTQKNFGLNHFFVRFVCALIVVFATYNPEGLSYYHWAVERLSEFSVLKAFIGVILLVGWIILIRATLGSLGTIGILLSIAFFGLAIWLIIDVLGLSANNARVISYIIQLMLAGVLSIGVSWSHVRRRISGQVDTDELDRNS